MMAWIAVLYQFIVLSIGFLEGHEFWKLAGQPPPQLIANPRREWDEPDTTLTLAFNRHPAQYTNEPLNLELSLAPLNSQDVLPIVPSQQHQASRNQPTSSLPLDQELSHNRRTQVTSHAFSPLGRDLPPVLPIVADDPQALGPGVRARTVSDRGPVAIGPSLVNDIPGTSEVVINPRHHQDSAISIVHPELSKEPRGKLHPLNEKPTSDPAHPYPTPAPITVDRRRDIPTWPKSASRGRSKTRFKRKDSFKLKLDEALVEASLKLALQKQLGNNILYPEEDRFLKDRRNYSLNFSLKPHFQWEYYRKLQRNVFRIKVNQPHEELPELLPASNSNLQLIYEKGDGIGKNLIRELGLPLAFGIHADLEKPSRIRSERLGELWEKMSKMHWIAEEFFPHVLPFLLTDIRALCYAFPSITTELQKTIRQIQMEAYSFYDKIRRQVLNDYLKYRLVYEQQIHSSEVLPKPIIATVSQELVQSFKRRSLTAKINDSLYGDILRDCRFLISFWMKENVERLFLAVRKNDERINCVASSILNKMIENLDS